MKTLTSTILTSLCAGVIGACAGTSGPIAAAEQDVPVTPVPAAVENQAEPLKLGDAVLAAAPSKGEEKKDAAGEQPGGLPSGHPPVGGAAPGGLPAGHPAVGGPQPGGLPSGHPPVGGPAGGLPSGHPEVGQPGGLPAGHPPTGGGQGAPARANENLPKESLTVRAVQGTKGGPAVGADQVLIEYYNAEGKVVGKGETKLNEKGQVTITGAPLSEPVQPLITIIHQGVEYRAPGEVMAQGAPGHAVDLTVFEATEQEPAWNVKMRHVILATSPQGVTVTDMISLNNPADKAWIGNKPSSGGKPVTLRLPLPAGASNVQFGGGFHECCTTVVNGQVEYAMALTPGDTQFQFSYTVPADANGSAKVELPAPAATQHLMVFLPEDGTTFTSDTLRRMEPKKGSSVRANSRFFVTDPHEKGKVVAFTITGLEKVKPGQAQILGPTGLDNTAVANAANPAAKVPAVAKVVGGVGAGVILVGGAAVVMFKGPRTTKQTRESDTQA